MSLLDTLKFVRGGVARKDLAPILNHFRIKNGVISGSNGSIAISAPIALTLDCQPKAAPFTEAIKICESMDATPVLSLTKAGRLTVAAGKFKVHIECLNENFPDVEPDGQEIPLEPVILEAFRVLEPLIGEDASRPWCRGVLLRGGSAFATNNAAIGQYWVNAALPFDLNIPDEAIREILRSKDAPVSLRATEQSATFKWSDGRQIKTQLLNTHWPDIAPVLDRACEVKPIPAGFFEGLSRLAKYTDAANRVFFSGKELRTSLVDEDGAAAELDEELPLGIYNLKLLSALDGLIEAVDFSLYPAPALFFGPNGKDGYPVFRGAIVGMKGGELK